MRIEYPNSASFILTENCNLACKYCFELGKHNKKIMSKEVSEKSIDYLIENAKKNNADNINVTYFGGEPLLNIDVMEHSFNYAIERCKKEDLKFKCSIITNCTIFNSRYEAFLLKWYSTLGYIDIQLSIDGIPEVQDEYRITIDGKGTSKLVESNVKKYFEFMEKYKIQKGVHVHGCVNKKSMPRLYESYTYFRNLGFKDIWFMPVHEEKWDDNDVTIFETQLKLISARILEDCIRENTADYYYGYASLANCKTQHPSAPCGAGKNYCSITAEGDLYPCHNFYFGSGSFKFGNVFTGEETSKRNIFLDYDSSNLFGEKSCSACDNYGCYRCIAVNYVGNDNMFIGFPAYCKLSKKENEFRINLKNKMLSIGLIKETKTLQQSDCTSHNSNDLLKKYIDIITPVVESIQNHINDINNKVEKLNVMEQKIDSFYDILENLIAALNNK